MTNRVFLFIILFLILGTVLFVFRNQVCFKKDCFFVELATTNSKKVRGLMFREELGLDRGMLFVYENEAKRSFWMKNVLIPLDIIWLNKDKEIVFIEKNLRPCVSDPCPVFAPNLKAQYVLELNGGTADKINLKVGDKAIFNILFCGII